METDINEEIKELKNILVDIRIHLAKMETIQVERTKATESLDNKFNTMKDEITQLDKKVTYAAGAVAVAVSLVSYLGNVFLKKIGVS